MSELENKFKELITKFYQKRKRVPTLDYILDVNDELYTTNTTYITKIYKPIYNNLIQKYNNLKTKDNKIDELYNLQNENIILRSYQEEYVNEALEELRLNNRCLINAPTGSGKTKMAFVIQSKLIKFNKRMIYVFVSPLLRINEQCLKDSYIYYDKKYNTSNNFNIFEEILVNSKNNGYIEKIKYILKHTNKNLLLSTTYQSIKYIFELNLDIDLIILDEAHTIPSYVHSKHYFKNLNIETDYQLTNEELEEVKQTKSFLKKKEWYNIFFHNKVKQRLFLTATPYNYQIEDTEKYGKNIQKILLGELIELNTLSAIKTYIATVSDIINIENTNYDRPDTASSILKFIKTTNRYRICIFVNNSKNANKLKNSILNCPLYKSFKNIKEPILYLSSENTNITEFSNNENIDNFNNNEIRIVISCKKLSMGVDIPCVDSIIFADPRMNSADISQCIGRGLRFFKYGEHIKECCILLIKYSNDEFDKRNKMIFEYLDYLSKNKVFKYINNVPEEHNNIEHENNKEKRETNLEEINIYNGILNLNINYYDEYSKYISDNNNIDEELIEYNKRLEEYKTLKSLCIKYNIISIDDYLKMIAKYKNKEINKITNPEIYFTEIKIPKNKDTIWHCWYHLFNLDTSKMPETYSDWINKINKLNLNNINIYLKYCETHDDMPLQPKLLYNNIGNLNIIINNIFD